MDDVAREHLARLALIREVYLKCYDETETFETIGEPLAYLLGAIATRDQVSLSKGYWVERALLRLLVLHFDKSHMVWNYVTELN